MERRRREGALLPSMGQIKELGSRVKDSPKTDPFLAKDVKLRFFQIVERVVEQESVGPLPAQEGWKNRLEVCQLVDAGAADFWAKTAAVECLV